MKKYSHAIFILLLEHDRITDLYRGETDNKLRELIRKNEGEVLAAIDLLKKEPS